MKIRTQYILNAFVFSMILLLASASVLIADQQSWETHQQEMLATQLEREAYELGYLTNDYLLYGESQQASRWESKFASSSQNLSSLKVNAPEQQALINNIQTNQQRLKAVFAEVKATLERESPGQGAAIAPAFMQTSWSRLEVQNQGIIFDASRLTRLLREQEDQLRRVAGLLSFVLIAAFGAFLLVNYGLTFRRVLKAIADLQAGARIIGSGNLDFAIAVRHADEIGELSRAFNRMTSDLKNVTASKAELEREIAERQRAEAALQEANELLEVRVKERTAELEQANRALQLEIAERQRAEETVKGERQRLYDVLETLPAYAILLSADYHVPFSNRFFRERFGESHGRCCYEFLFGRNEPCEICESYTVMKTNAPHRWEWVGPDGRNYDIYDFPFTDADGSHLVMEMGLDITERKRAEAELLRYQAHLEELVKERTAEVESRNVQLAARTAELSVANENLRGARAAALNVMEDALEARNKVEQVNQQLRLLSQALESAANGVAITDRQGNLLWVNPAFTRLTGYSAAEAVGQNPRVLKSGQHPTEFYRALWETILRGEPWRGQMINRRKDGALYHEEMTITPVRAGGGEITHFVAIKQDITQQLQAEQALRESEERYRSLFNGMTEGFGLHEIICNEHGEPRDYRFLDVNPAFERLTGLRRDDVIGKTVRQAMPDTEPMWIQIYGRVALTGEPVHLEEYSGALDRHYEVFAYRPAPGQFASVFMDVTERKQAEQERGRLLKQAQDYADRLRAVNQQLLEQAEELEVAGEELNAQNDELRAAQQALETERRRYQELFDFAPGGYLVTDQHGTIREANRAAAELVHLQADRMVGKPLAVLVLEEEHRAFYARLEKVREKNEFGQWETCLAPREGAPLPALVDVAPELDAQGRLVGLRWLLRDITERKKREEELHRLNRTLRARSHSDQALMRVTTETEYMQEVCKIIVQDCGHAMVWIGLAEQDEGKTVRPVAYAGFEEGYLETLHITWADTERGRGPTGTAVRTGKPSFCRNMLTDPQFTLWRAEALRRGYAASLVLPLLDDGRAFGALTVYFREPDPFTEDEVTLLAGLADDLVYGIRTIKLRMAHARAEEALRQSEERFSKAFYNSPVGITLTRTVDGSFADINPTFLKMTGLQREDVIEHNSAELNLTLDGDYSGALLKHVRETGGSRDAEFQVRVKDGKVRHWLVNAQTLILGADEFILGMLVDITQRKQAEEALRRAKDELELRVQERTAELARANAYNRSLIEASLDPLVMIGPEGKITDVNAATELATAYSRQELIGTDFSDYFTKPERARAVYQRVFHEGSVRNYELELVHRDGHLTSVLYNASVYRDEAGQVVGVFAAARDITKRKLAEGQLRLQSAALEAAANGIVITDVQGNVQWANPAFARMSGYARGEVIGQNIRFLKSGVLAGQDYQQLWETILSGQVWRGELVNRRKDGSLYTEEQTIAPVLDAEAEITHFVAIKQDITDRKWAEAQLERNNEELRALSQAERSQRLLAETLSAANLALTQTLDLATVMETLLDYVERLVPYDSANVMLLDAESRLSVRVTRGYERWVDAGQARAITFDVQANPILKELFATRTSILVPDTRTHPDWETRPGAEHVQSWLGVPLLAGGNVIGVYSLDKAEPAFFTQEHVRRAEMLVGQAAVAIQNAWLFEQVRAGRERLQSLSRRLVEVQEAERHYVARELHDEVGQAVTSLKFSLGQLGAETDPAQHAARIAELKHMTDEVLESLHRLAMNLRPASLDHLGLVSALNQYVRAIGDRYGLIAQFKAVDMAERMPPTIETALYRIVQEALTNVVRHARATRVDVLLERRGDQVIVVIEDNGLGFDAPAAHTVQSGHLGLVGMQERAEMLGGSLVIESTVGGGTTVAVEVPDVYSYPHRG